ncbi:MAG: nuclease-related domain-containing protein, partial [bacterium]|nr:nuclease-related domain-containing protein [bacterium]
YSWLKEVVKKENILRNITLQNTKFDIDLMVIGDKGIIAIEVKNLSNPVCFEDDEYFYEKNGNKALRSPKDDPRFKFKKHIYFLIKYLEKNELGFVKIKKILVFTNGKVSWDGKAGIYIIKDKNSLENYINKLEVDPELTPQVCEKIKTLLDKK